MKCNADVNNVLMYRYCYDIRLNLHKIFGKLSNHLWFSPVCVCVCVCVCVWVCECVFVCMSVVAYLFANWYAIGIINNHCIIDIIVGWCIINRKCEVNRIQYEQQPAPRQPAMAITTVLSAFNIRHQHRNQQTATIHRNRTEFNIIIQKRSSWIAK